MKKRKGVYKSLLWGIIATSVFSTTVFAKYFTASDTVVNKFGIGSIEVKVNENFKPPEKWDGTEVNKEVKIDNTAKNSEIVRVSIIPRWVDEEGNPWIGDSNIVKLNLVNVKNVNEVNQDEKNIWLKGNDEYYYYSNVLKTGQSTSTILKSVTLDTSKFTDFDKKRYKGKKLIVEVKTEGIEPKEKIVNNKWNNLEDGIEKYIKKICNENK